MRQIAFYGKGGIGKSTVVSNLSAILGINGNKILQIGCDPKHDSTRTLLGGELLDPVLNIAKKIGSSFGLEDIMKKGFANVDCIEAGGPEPGIGCAGRGITLVMDIIKKLGVFDKDYDYIFYDVLGDVVCGGFAVPIRQYYAKEVYIVVSGEFMSLYAGNNIAKALANFGKQGPVRLGGIIGNERKVKNEKNIIEAFAKKLGTKLITFIPRDNIVQEAEGARKTVIEYDINSDLGFVYKKLSEEIKKNKDFVIPKPMGEQELEHFYFSNLNKGE